MRPLILAFAMFLLGGCLDNGSASVHLKGDLILNESVDRRFEFGPPEASPGIDPVLNVHTAWYTAENDAPLGRVTSLTLYLPVLRFGPVDGTVAVSSSSRNSALSGPAKYQVEDIRFTGDGGHPVDVHGTFTGQLLGMHIGGGKQEQLEATDGRFTYRPSCESTAGGEKSFMYCGTHSDGSEDITFGEWEVKADDCPTEIREAFAGTPGAEKSWKGTSFSVRGAKHGLSCVRTMEGTRAICGTQVKGMKAAGCSWRATAIGSGGASALNLMVFAEGSGNCEESVPPSCVAWLQALPK